MRLMLWIAVKNGLGIMAGYILNALCMDPCDENICSCCGAEFGIRCGAVVVLNRALYGLNMASNSFHKYFGDFLRDPGFTPYIADQDKY